MIKYYLFNLLTKYKYASDINNCIQRHTLCKFKSELKLIIIDKCSDKCKFWSELIFPLDVKTP